jgi:CRISPR-associated protein Cas6
MSIIDVAFALRGNIIPTDHGYALYSALSSYIPQLHGNSEVAIHPIYGRLNEDRTITLTQKSRLIIRLHEDLISLVLPLIGRFLQIGEYGIKVGLPTIQPLIPKTNLYSRLVIIKGFIEENGFLEAVQRQLNDMDIKGKPYLVYQPQVEEKNRGNITGSHSLYLRRTICIQGKEIVGFAVGVNELTAEESIRLQEMGIGGRRRFGCGIFIPVKSK